MTAPIDWTDNQSDPTHNVVNAAKLNALGAVVNTTLPGATAALTNKTINASLNTITNITVANMAASAIVTSSEQIAANNVNTALPTAAAVKAYVDAAIAAAIAAIGTSGQQPSVVPTFESYGAATTVGPGTSTVVSAPPLTAVGDIILVPFSAHENADTVVAPAGFAESPASPVTVVFGQIMHVYWKRLSAPEPLGTVYTFTHDSIYAQGQALRFSGCVAIDVPIEAAVADGTTATVAGVTKPVSTTTLGDNRLLVWVADNYDGQLTCTPPTGFTEVTDVGLFTLATKDVTSPGSVAGVTGTWSMSVISSEVWMGALKPMSTETPPTKKIIYFSYFNPNAQFLNTNRVYCDSLPFDGVSFHMLNAFGGAHTMSATAISQAQYAAELDHLGTGTWNQMIDKWPAAYAQPPNGANVFTGDTQWGIAGDNFGHLAAACSSRTSSHHIKGILFDTETYFGQLWQGPDADHDAAYARGYEIMAKIVAAWPTAVVMTTHSTWASDSRTYNVYNGTGSAWDDLSTVYNNVGSFFAGMVAATFGTSAQMIDGTEMYTARTAPAYNTIYNWNKYGVGVAGTGCVVPSGDQAEWAAGAVDVGFGVFDLPWNGATMDENIWKSTLQLAVNRTDEHVWAYTERYDWLGVNSAPNVPASWVARTSEVVR